MVKYKIEEKKNELLYGIEKEAYLREIFDGAVAVIFRNGMVARDIDGLDFTIAGSLGTTDGNFLELHDAKLRRTSADNEFDIVEVIYEGGFSKPFNQSDSSDDKLREVGFTTEQINAIIEVIEKIFMENIDLLGNIDKQKTQIPMTDQGDVEE